MQLSIIEHLLRSKGVEHKNANHTYNPELTHAVNVVFVLFLSFKMSPNSQTLLSCSLACVLAARRVPGGFRLIFYEL